MNQPIQSTQIIDPLLKPKHPHGNNTGLKQAYQWRDLAHSEAVALKDMPCETLDDRLARAKAFQSLNTVWFNSGERIRVLRGKPLPGSLRPERKPKRTKPISSAPSEEPDKHDTMIIEDLGDGAGARVSIVKK